MTSKKVALMFPGQGSQCIGMGEVLYRTRRSARAVFEEANDALGFDLAALCFSGDRRQLDQTVNAQPALLACSVASYRVVCEELALDVACGAGHSVGEFSALTCAGVLTLRDAVRLVALRGSAMQRASPAGTGAMAAIFGCEEQVVRRCCRELTRPEHVVCLANINSREQVAISGHTAAVEAACAALEKAGGVSHPLPVSVPAHCSLMQPAALDLARALGTIELGDARFPVFSNATSGTYGSTREVCEGLVQQLTSVVDWRRIVTGVTSMRPEAVLELGSRTVLRDLFKLECSSIPAFAVNDAESLEKLRTFLETPSDGSALEDTAWTRFIGMALAVAAATPNRCFERPRYQFGVVEPYRELEAARRRQDESGMPPRPEHLRRAADLLRRILRTKKVSEGEREARFAHLFAATRTAPLFPDFEI